MDLKEKIEYEFNCFFLDQMRTSKENIFASSEEITIKKNLTEQLYIFADEISEEEQRRLLFQNNILSSLYCFYKTKANRYPEKDLKTFVHRWFESYGTEGMEESGILK